jgi:hypothetical protein
MGKITLIVCLILTSVAWAKKGPFVAQAVRPAQSQRGPVYASESQRARAVNYWLPQNQLPEDAGVAGQRAGGG